MNIGGISGSGVGIQSFRINMNSGSDPTRGTSMDDLLGGGRHIIWKGGGFYRPLFYCIENFFDIIYVSKMVEIPVLNNETGCEIILLVL